MNSEARLADVTISDMLHWQTLLMQCRSSENAKGLGGRVQYGGIGLSCHMHMHASTVTWRGGVVERCMSGFEICGEFHGVPLEVSDATVDLRGVNELRGACELKQCRFVGLMNSAVAVDPDDEMAHVTMEHTTMERGGVTEGCVSICCT